MFAVIIWWNVDLLKIVFTNPFELYQDGDEWVDDTGRYKVPNAGFFKMDNGEEAQCKTTTIDAFGQYLVAAFSTLAEAQAYLYGVLVGSESRGHLDSLLLKVGMNSVN